MKNLPDPIVIDIIKNDANLFIGLFKVALLIAVIIGSMWFTHSIMSKIGPTVRSHMGVINAE